MKKQYIFLIMCVLLLLNVNSIAQIPTVPPQAFNYQAVLRDLAGNPLPYQTVSLKFSILDTASVIEYVETHDTITDQFGSISVEIGRGTPLFGAFDSIFWGACNHYLEVGIDTTGNGSYTTMGTSQLISVPYAMYAQYAGPWIFYPGPPDPVLPPSMICFPGNQYTCVGIGTVTPNPEAILDLQSSDQGFLVPRLTAVQRLAIPVAQASNGLMVFDIDSNRFCYYDHVPQPGISHWDVISNTSDLQSLQLWNPSGANMYYNSGNVGIGNSNPQTPLQVSSGDVYIDNIGSGVIMKSPNGNCWRMTVDDTGTPVYTLVTCP
jgi:hypothetical protein